MAAPLILIAEDDPLSAKLMHDVLEADGYRTIQVQTGLDAVLVAGSSRPDAVVMDIGLPGMDGVEATRQIRAAAGGDSVIVIAVTAYAMPGDEERMRQAGSDAYLTKPLRFSEFLVLLHRLVPPGRPAQSADTGSEK